MAILQRHKSTVYGLESDLLALQLSDTNESAARLAADTTLQSNIDTEASTRAAADTTLTDNLATEVGLREALQVEVDTTQTGAGLGTTGTYSAEVTANFIGAATSLKDADNKLDAAVKAEEVARIAADTTLQTNINTLSTAIAALGNAFNYVGSLTGGDTELTAFDMSTLPVSGQDAGDYYKVTTAGYVKFDAVTIFANVGDGIVFNTFGTIDKIDNTDSNVQGTVNEIAVAGSADTGFVVSIDGAFSGRVSTLESGLTTETNARIAAGSTLQSNIDAEATARIAADALKLDKSANLSDVASVSTARTNLDVYSTTEVDALVTSGGAIFITESLLVTADQITTTYAPKNGVVFNFATVRYTDINFVSYDIPVTLVGGQTNVFNIHPNTTGEFDTKNVLIQYAYIPTI